MFYLLMRSIEAVDILCWFSTTRLYTYNETHPGCGASYNTSPVFGEAFVLSKFAVLVKIMQRGWWHTVDSYMPETFRCPLCRFFVIQSAIHVMILHLHLTVSHNLYFNALVEESAFLIIYSYFTPIMLILVVKTLLTCVVSVYPFCIGLACHEL